MNSSSDKPTRTPPPQTAFERRVPNPTYLRNMSALWRVNTKLAQLIDLQDDLGDIRITQARSGAWTAYCPGSQEARPVYLHSRYDPVSEAVKFVDGIRLDDKFCVVVAGFGLGYHLARLYQRLKGDALIVVSEPDLGLIRAALECVDLSEMLESKRLVILYKSDKGSIHQALQPHSGLVMMGAEFVSTTPSRQINTQFHQDVRQAITDYIAYRKIGMVTLVANARITVRNLMNNLPRYLTSPHIGNLKNLCEGFPIIMVAAGPSVTRNLPILEQLQDRAIIIAVQTMLKPLLNHGIRPHFVTSLDYHEISTRFYEGVDDFGRIHMVAEPKVSWHVADMYTGPLSFLYNDFYSQCLGRDLGGRPGLQAGTTVAHLAFYLAQYLGGDPVIMLGQDLGFANGLYYAPGTALHDVWRVELNRFTNIETREWDRVVRQRPILRRVADNRGGTIFTDEQMFTYLQQFERDFSRARTRIIDTSIGGAAKSNTVVMDFAQAAEQYLTRPVPGNMFAYMDAQCWHDTSRLAEGAARLDETIDKIARMKDISEQTIDVLEEMRTLVDNPEQFNRRMARVDTLRSQVRALDDVYSMVAQVATQADLRRYQHDRRIAAADDQGPERARRQLARDVEFVRSIVDGCDALTELIEEGRQKVIDLMQREGIDYTPRGDSSP